jgi:hypothetical protein
MPVVPVAPAGPVAVQAPAPGKASFGAALRAKAAPAPCPAPPTPSPARLGLEALERARERLDGVLAAARRGRTFSAQELLALQADAYRYSQTVEVASKVVEHGAQAVKQAVNTQV